MLALTGLPQTPWHLISAEDKRFARLEIIKTACREIRSRLNE
jgi:polyphosphate kinase 2 (PPK2 family)